MSRASLALMPLTSILRPKRIWLNLKIVYSNGCLACYSLLSHQASQVWLAFCCKCCRIESTYWTAHGMNMNDGASLGWIIQRRGRFQTCPCLLTRRGLPSLEHPSSPSKILSALIQHPSAAGSSDVDTDGNRGYTDKHQPE